MVAQTSVPRLSVQPNILAEFVTLPSNVPMLTFCRHLRSVIPFVTSTLLIAGCSTTTIRETELAITPTESSVSFSRTAQEEIARLGLNAEQLGDPTSLESNEQLASAASAPQRSLLISEAWYLRGQNDIEVPLPVSLERFLRSAHYSYEGLFGESGCQDSKGQLCKDLTTAYNRSVREIARLTNNGTLPPAPAETRYIVDAQADNDPLTLTEWEVTLSDDTSSTNGTLGAAGTGCQGLASESTARQRPARQCVPLAFIVTFDERVTDERAHAHLAAFNTLEQSEIQLHSRAVPLASREQAPWTEIFTPGEETISCLGNAHPALPTVIFLTPSTQSSHEWPVIGAAVANDPVIREHYNFCALNLTPGETATPQGEIDEISGALATLLPNLKAPAQVILITQGVPGDLVAKNVKVGLKTVVPGATAPLAIAGTLTFPPPPPPVPNTIPVPISSASELSRSGTVALGDSKRLLTRLANEDDGMFGGLTRSSLSPSADERLSPVM